MPALLILSLALESRHLSKVNLIKYTMLVLRSPTSRDRKHFFLFYVLYARFFLNHIVHRAHRITHSRNRLDEFRSYVSYYVFLYCDLCPMWFKPKIRMPRHRGTPGICVYDKSLNQNGRSSTGSVISLGEGVFEFPVAALAAAGCW